MSITETNQYAVREVRSSFYQSCNTNSLSTRDLLILILEPLVTDRSVSVLVDQILEKGLSYLASLSEFELSVLFGINERQSLPIVALFEFSRRAHAVKKEEITIIRSPQDCYEYLEDLKFLDKEHFVLLFLDTKNKVIGRETISIGTINTALVHPREVFKAAIRRGAVSIIGAHNHPSGDGTPSKEDVELTKRLVEAGELIGIDLLDHVIIGSQSNTSMKERGLL
ncbi:RadC family protein [Paenibacillus odorifer]|uniref:RadC family protein n=1 Tax=Paenibacillus odorifer TaxID=189426 RepID=UPI00096EBE2C|nr:DNA repair protein RadC [Paenibacillus odorifer]